MVMTTTTTTILRTNQLSHMQNVVRRYFILEARYRVTMIQSAFKVKRFDIQVIVKGQPIYKHSIRCNCIIYNWKL